jgi:hypothetical protein
MTPLEVCTGVCTRRTFAACLSQMTRLAKPKRPDFVTPKGAYGIRTPAPSLPTRTNAGDALRLRSHGSREKRDCPDVQARARSRSLKHLCSKPGGSRSSYASSTPRAPRSCPRITRLCSISCRVLGNPSREPWLGHPSTRAIHCPAEHLGSAVQWRTRRSTAGSARRESGSCKRDGGGWFHSDRNFRLFGEALRRAAFRDAPLCTKR